MTHVPSKHVTASKIYAHALCPHRVWKDEHADPAERDPESEFLRLLWEKGVRFEKEALAAFGPYADMSGGSLEERWLRTKAALDAREKIIYQGVLIVDNLVGAPDVLELQPDGTYLPIDIKSGRGLEGDEEGGGEKLKEKYAMQLALYADALIRLGYATRHVACIYDVEGERVAYDLDLPRVKTGSQTLWDRYLWRKDEVERLVDGTLSNDPALCGACKLCHWYSSCKKRVYAADDLSRIFKLGRPYRDRLREDAGIATVAQLAAADEDELNELKESRKADGDKEFMKDLGPGRIRDFVRRAKVIAAGKAEPLVTKPFSFPRRPIELYFDIEDDPTQDIVYLHGVLERREGIETFYKFVADDATPEAERKAWEEFWAYIRSLPEGDFVTYHYSPHERTTYQWLCEKHPGVVTEGELAAFYDKESGNAVDLYQDIVDKCTDWPLHSYSVKSIAQHIGFAWRDAHPSGAASIEWYNDWLSDRDPAKLQRIVDYNEDDCRAMLVIKDHLMQFAS